MPIYSPNVRRLRKTKKYSVGYIADWLVKQGISLKKLDPSIIIIKSVGELNALVAVVDQ